MNGSNFFGNRYGIDNLNIALIVAALVFSVLSRIFPQLWVFTAVGILLIVLVFCRALSTKQVLRRAENEKFLAFWYALRDWLRAPHLGRPGAGGTRTFKCPSCGQKCRVPRGRGAIAITCPRCRQDFIRRS